MPLINGRFFLKRMELLALTNTKELTQNQSAHLSLIQGVIIRMGTNSFSLKALAVAIAAAVIALAGTGQSSKMTIYPIAGILPVVIFWIMDARYLHIEKCYRALYDDIRNGGLVSPFDMNYRPYKKQVESTAKLLLWNWSETPFYSAIVITLAATYLVVR